MRRAAPAARTRRFAEASLLLVALLLSPWHLALSPRFAPSAIPHATHHHLEPAIHAGAEPNPDTPHDTHEDAHDGLYCLRCVLALGLLPALADAAPRGKTVRARAPRCAPPHAKRLVGFNRSARAPPA